MPLHRSRGRQEGLGRGLPRAQCRVLERGATYVRAVVSERWAPFLRRALHRGPWWVGRPSPPRTEQERVGRMQRGRQAAAGQVEGSRAPLRRDRQQVGWEEEKPQGPSLSALGRDSEKLNIIAEKGLFCSRESQVEHTCPPAPDSGRCTQELPSASTWRPAGCAAESPGTLQRG